jgi:hypothetical protein
MLYRCCAYPYIFETPPAPDAKKMRLYTAAPHPFVFELALDAHKATSENTLDIGFSLFGRGNQYLPYVLHALEKAGTEGLGGRHRQRSQLVLDKLQQTNNHNGSQWHTIYQPGQTLSAMPAGSPDIPDMPERIIMHFITPLRLNRDKHNITPEQFQFSDIFINLMRRISMLSYFHTDAALEADFSTLANHARTIEFSDKQLGWHDWSRYSSRQKTAIQMGGLTGTAELDMHGLNVFWPYLWLGQWTHAGKGTSMGLGHYRIETASLPQQTQPVE